MSRNKRRSSLNRAPATVQQAPAIVPQAPQVKRAGGRVPLSVPAGTVAVPLGALGAAQSTTSPLQPQYGVPWRGRYPGQNLQGDNSTPASAYDDTPPSEHSQRPGSIFPPGDPVRPVPGLPVRQFSYPVGANITAVPRSTELIGFDTLRMLAETYYGVGLCKRAYFRILQRLDLTFVPKPELVGPDDDTTGDKWRTPALHMRDWFQDGPSKRPGEDLHGWMKAVENELLDLDAVGIWLKPTNTGTLFALEYVAGDTLQVLGDDGARVPLPPAPAYRQALYGAPARLFTAASGPRVDGYQLDYLKTVSRANSLYGRSPVEDMILQVNQALRKGAYDLRRYTDGATPEGIVTTMRPELFALTPDQVSEYEQLWNAVLAGNDALRVRTKFLQPGFDFTSTKQQEVAIEFDNFLLNICVAMFGLTKEEVSFTDTSNRAVSSGQEAVTYRNAVKPSADYFASYFTRIARRYDGQPLSVVNAYISYPGAPAKSKQGSWDARFMARWGGIEEQDDWNKKAGTYIALKNAGIIGPTKALRLLGIPLDKDEPEIPAYQVAQGGMQSVIIVPDLAQHRDAMQEANAAALDAKTASSEQVTEAMKHGGMMGQPGGAPGANPTNPIAAQAAAAGKPEAAQQAANGGSAVAQKAAAQQVGAKVASAQAAPATPTQKRMAETDDTEEATTEATPEATPGDDEYADRVSDQRGRGPALADAAAGLLAAGGWDVQRGGRDAVGAVDGPGGRAPHTRAALAPTGGAAGGAPGSGGRGTTGAGGSRGPADTRVQRVDAPAAGGSRAGGTGSAGGKGASASDDGDDDDTGTGAGSGGSGRTGITDRAGATASNRADTASAARYAAVQAEPSHDTRRTGSGTSGGGGVGDREEREEAASGQQQQQEERNEERSEDWRRWRERALKAVRRGERVAPFASAAIPPDLHAWVSERLNAAMTPDDVRAIFAEAREREERGTSKATASKATAKDAKAEGENHSGVMIAFLVPPEVAEQLAVPGGVAPEDHHITLAYLGDKDDLTPQQARKLRRSVAGFAEDEQPLPAARVTGVGSFPTSGETGLYPLIAKIEQTPALMDWRERLMQHLEDDGFTPSRQFDYTPHITLHYLPDGTPAPVDDVPHVAVPLRVVTLAIGDDHHQTVVGNEQFPDEAAKRDAAPDPFARFLDALTARMEAQTAQIAARQEQQLRELRTDVLATLR